MLTRKEFLARSGVAASLLLAPSGSSASETKNEQHTASVTHFGAKGDGVADDTAAVQAAADTGRNIYFPVGRFRISRSIHLQTGGRMVFSDGGTPSMAEKSNQAVIVVDRGWDGAVFVAEGHMTCFVNLRMEGPGKQSKTTAILFEKRTNTDDVDGRVEGCVVQQFGVGVRYVGRGLRMDSNSFASVRHVLQIDWPDKGLLGEGLQRLPYGMRAFHLLDNRVHTCSCFVVNQGKKAEHLWGLCMTGNLLDIGDALFLGAATYSNFSGNVICHSRRTPLYFDSVCHSTLIANNVISGDHDPGGKQPAHGIVFEGQCHDVTVTGNVFANIRKSAIAFSGAPQENVVINGNVFRNAGSDSPAAQGVIRFGKPASNFAIAGNSFQPGPKGGMSMIVAAQQSLSGFQVVGNVRHPDFPLMGEYVDGGRNRIVD